MTGAPSVRVPLLLSLLSVTLLSACAGSPPQKLLTEAERFVECPTSPNCVSSDSANDEQRIAAFRINPEAAGVWQAVKAAVQSMPHTTLVTDQNNYLHAECHSALMGYVDDLQLQLRPKLGVIAVYSASRVGYSDFGVNRKRIEQLQNLLLQQDLILVD